MTDLGPADATSFERVDQHLIAGGELLRQSRLEDAQRELLTALELEPESTKALALLGLAYFRASKFAEALPVYRRLVGLASTDASHHLNLGLVLLKLGDAGGAASSLEKSRDIDPSQGRAVSYLGLAYARGGRFAEAYQAFLQARQHDLAKEIAENLTEQERLAIEGQFLRQSAAPVTPAVETASVRFVSPTEPPLAAPPPAALPPSEPRAAVDATAANDDAAFDALDSMAAEPDPEPPPPRAPTRPSEPPRRLGDRVSTPPPPPAGVDLVDDLDAIVEEVDRGAISRAVAQVVPSLAHGGTRVAPGNRPPQPLSEFATTRLVRLEDGEEPFEISSGGVLIVRVAERMFSRTEGVDVTGGQLSYEPAQRRSRGQNLSEPFASDGRPMFVVSGQGHLIAAPLGGVFTAVDLDEDIFYLREDLVFAFEPTLRWENGHVPGSSERISIVQFRGSGAVAFRTTRPLVSVKLAQDRVLYVDAGALAGWIGRVVPRSVTPADAGPGSELFVECTGEGVVLVEEDQPLRPTP